MLYDILAWNWVVEYKISHLFLFFQKDSINSPKLIEMKWLSYHRRWSGRMQNVNMSKNWRKKTKTLTYCSRWPWLLWMSPELVPSCCGLLLPPPTLHLTSLGCTHHCILYMLSSCNRKSICEVNRWLLCFFLRSLHLKQEQTCTMSHWIPRDEKVCVSALSKYQTLHQAIMSGKINQWCLRIEFCSILIKFP